MGSGASIAASSKKVLFSLKDKRLARLAKEYKMDVTDLHNQKKNIQRAIGGNYLSKKHIQMSISIPASDEMVQSLTETLSSDGKRVSVTDYICGMTKFCYGSPQQRFDYCFKLFDYDKGGELSHDELESIIHSLLVVYNGKKTTRKMRKKLAKKYFKKMDVDGDGDVSLEEFRKVVIVDRSLTNAIMNLAKFVKFNRL